MNRLFKYQIRTESAKEQIVGFYNSRKQFNLVPAARRALKTETAKRRLRKRALLAHDHTSRFYVKDRLANFFIACPTLPQTIRIYWQDMLLLLSPFIMKKDISSKTLQLINGTTIYLMSGETPERFEGMMWDGGILDEYGNMKEEVWTHHLSECLADTNGYCDFIGVPEGQNHYYHLYKYAQEHPEQWDTWHWVSADVLPDETIQYYKEMLDEVTFRQEMLGSFENYQGRAYYNFSNESIRPLVYDNTKPIIAAFDFNTSPGVAIILQEQMVEDHIATGVIKEVYVEQHSNTAMVCSLLAQKIAGHKGIIELHGDASGGAHRSCSDKSDWEIVINELRKSFPTQLRPCYLKDNPYVRDRINAMNIRLKNGVGQRNLFVDNACKKTIEDFNCVTLDDKGELDKKEKKYTHITDAIGYYISTRFPVLQYNNVLPQYWK